MLVAQTCKETLLKSPLHHKFKGSRTHVIKLGGKLIGDTSMYLGPKMRFSIFHWKRMEVLLAKSAALKTHVCL